MSLCKLKIIYIFSLITDEVIYVLILSENLFFWEKYDNEANSVESKQPTVLKQNKSISF